MKRLVTAILALAIAQGALAHEKEVEGEAEGGDQPQPQAVCEGGSAEVYPCWNVDLLAWLPPGVFTQGLGNDIWGWTDPASGREYALIGLQGGTAFVDLSDPTDPVYLGLLPTQTLPSTWRDIKTYQAYAFVVSEARNHGLQIFDLRQLANVVSPPVVFSPTAHYPGFGNSHNLALDEETGLAVAVGTQTCAGGLHMIDVTRPEEPLFAGCFSDDGYTHDAQCVIYRGPDLEHDNREICFGSNEDTVTIVDVTSRDAPFMISRQGYAGSAYTHQGWLSEDHRYFFLGDELDERRNGHNARTYVWDVSDLEAPFVVGHFTGPQASIDHNLFVVGRHVFEANYRSGFRVLRMGDLSRAEMTEVAFFDTFPGGDGFTFSGAWGVYPFFESGIVVVSDINRGLFVLAPDLGAVPECGDGIDDDEDGLTDFPADPACENDAGPSELPRNDVSIDVRPHSPHNLLLPLSFGSVSVAVLGSASFDVGSVDPETLRFGPDGAPALPRWRHFLDANGDGHVDLVARYLRRLSGIERGDDEACLRFDSWGGTPYEACDVVRTLPPEPKPRPKKPWRWRGLGFWLHWLFW